MNIIIFNFFWMTFNILLALIPIFFGWKLLQAQNLSLKFLYFVIWLLFLPNTIYLFTDLINLINQWGIFGAGERFVFLFQYGILEIIAFFTSILALYPFEKLLNDSVPKKKKRVVNIIIILINFLCGFGVVLGRVERINSWDVVTQPLEVVKASINILVSPDLIFLVILFGLFGNFFYFLFRKPVINYLNTYLAQVGVLK